MKTKVLELNGEKYIMKKPGVKELIGIRSRAMNSRDTFQLVYYQSLLKSGFEKPRSLSEFGWEMTQETFEVEGVKYTMQRPDLESVLEIRSRMLAAGELSQVQAYEDYLEYIVVQPKCTLDDFEDNISHLDEVMKVAENFMVGHPNMEVLDTLMKECEVFLYGGK